MNYDYALVELSKAVDFTKVRQSLCNRIRICEVYVLIPNASLNNLAFSFTLKSTSCNRGNIEGAPAEVAPLIDM